MFKHSVIASALLMLVYGHYAGANSPCRNPLLGYGRFANVRLVGFNSSLVGYLEVCRDGEWKSATTNGGEWGRKEATVVCRELGYLDAITFSHIEGRELIQKAKRIHFDSISCAGTEGHLSECPSTEDMGSSPTPATLHNQILVLCNENPILGAIRLVSGGSKSSEGILEVYNPHPSYRWSTVCTAEWNDADALVACRQMGFSSGKSKHYSFDNYARVLPWKRYNLFHCNGTEEVLLDCRHKGPYPYKCSTDTYAGVVCEAGDGGQEALKPFNIGLIVLSAVLFVFFLLLLGVVLFFMAKRMKRKIRISTQHGIEMENRLMQPFQYPDISNFAPPPSYEQTILRNHQESQSESVTTALLPSQSQESESADLNSREDQLSSEESSETTPESDSS